MVSHMQIALALASARIFRALSRFDVAVPEIVGMLIPVTSRGLAISRFRSQNTAKWSLMRAFDALLLCLLLGGSLRCLGQDPTKLPTLTKVRQISELPPQEADRHYPVELTGTITCFDLRTEMCFIQDDSGGVYFWVAPRMGLALKPGQIARLTGSSAMGKFTPILNATTATALDIGVPPKPERLTLRELATGRQDAQWVETEGTVQAEREDWGHLLIELVDGEQTLKARLLSFIGPRERTLVGSRVRVRGVLVAEADEKRHVTGVQLMSPTATDLSVLDPLLDKPFSLPVREIATLTSESGNGLPDRQVHVRGSVTLVWPAKALVIQDTSGCIRVLAQQQGGARVGDEIEVVGFPMTGGLMPVIGEAVIRRIGVATTPPSPVEPKISHLLSGLYENRLIELEADLEARLKTAEDDDLLALRAGDRSFRAVLSATRGQDDRFARLAPGSHLRVTGVCSLVLDEYQKPSAFRLWLRSPADVEVLRGPPWVTARRVWWAAGGCATGLGVAAIWLVMIRQGVAKQTVAIRQREARLEARYSDLFENANDVIFSYDLSGNLTSLNRAGEVLLGYSRAEAVGLSLSRILTPESWGLIQHQLHTQSLMQAHTSLELEAVSKSGEHAVLEANSRLDYHEGSLLGVKVIARDITERQLMKKRSEAFSRLGHRLSAVTSPEEAAEVIFEVADGLLGWDACTLELCGPGPGRVTPIHAADLINGKRRRVALDALPTSPTPLLKRVILEGAQLILRQAPLQFSEDALPFGDRGRPSASLIFVPIRHGTEVVGVLSIQSYTLNAYDQDNLDTLQDLADHCAVAIERTRAEARVREQARLIDLAQDAILVRDLNGFIQSANPASERLLGWSAAEFIGRNVKDLIYRDSTQFEEATRRLMDVGEWQGDVQVSAKGGRELTVQSRWTLVRDGQGVSRSVLSILTDMTEKRQLEAKFLRAQRMESLGVLAGGMAHELNNALAPVQMAMGLIAPRLPDRESASFVDMANQSVERAAQIVRQMLTFARGTAGKRLPLKMWHLVKDMEQIVQETFPKTITVTASIARDDWEVRGDPTQLHQVLMNLCVNARDAMPRGGDLTLQVDNVRLDSQYTAINTEAKVGPYVLVTVSDTGSGMTDSVMDHLFEPFFTTKEVGKGTGLGLSTSLGIIKSHGGFIKVTSRLGHGSSFRVYLPAIVVPESSNEPTAPPTLRTGKGELLLVVDDERTVRTICQHTLELHGYQVLTAQHGADGVAVYSANRNRVQLVLTDMLMPVMDGPSLVHALKTIEPKVRIVAMSGRSAEYRRLSPVDGLLGGLTKPFTAAELLDTVADALKT